MKFKNFTYKFSKDKVVRVDIKLVFLFAVLSLFTFLKVCLFEWFAFGGLLLSSLWKNPIAFGSFYLPKICSALFVGSMVLLFKRKWLTVIFSTILDLWIIANLIFFRSRNESLLIDVYSFSLLGDLHGFESSIFMYVDWKCLFFLIVTLLYAFIIFLCDDNNRSFKGFGCAIVVVLLLDFVGTELLRYQYYRDPIIRYTNQDHYVSSLNPSIRETLFQHSTTRSVSSFSIIHLIGWDLIDACRTLKNEVVFFEEEKVALERCVVSPGYEAPLVDGPLVLIVFESLEDWAVNETCTPNLMRFMENHHHFMATSVVPQVRGAHSMDGQMIINTGLLPLIRGSVPYLFPTNNYPSICDFFSGYKVTVVPHGKDVYNQEYMSRAFGYDSTMTTEMDDSALVAKGLFCLEKGCDVLQLITIASHSPFTDGAQKSSLFLDSSCPDVISRYMKAVHYSDECLGALFRKIDEDSCFKNAVVVITGDHNALYSEARESLVRFSSEHDLCFDVNNPYCPLIIISSLLDSNVVVDNELVYQMDVYPTIMNLLGVDFYEWKGFGVNLLDSKARNNRFFSPDQALELSDKLIKSNYFKKIIDR